ncbi:M6 family metalloprotease domain-containing protein [Paenibacillus cymbidii]|uniref:M6 family metalloprotease domain-containing protein n=1 Tax=Paenibacillus cymbidii TaxID=1639034 RepID=UPI001081DDB0|nr:M6 family metalloprotease domain-containing protein [Paenibacillus cymbidii]
MSKLWGRKPLAIGLTALLALQLAVAGTASAIAPPRPGELEKFQQEGTLEQHAEAAEALGGHKVEEDLAEQLPNKLRELTGAAASGQSGDQAAPYDGGDVFRMMESFQFAPPSGRTGSMPRTGTAKALVLLIDFPDVRATADNPVADVQSSFFGNGLDAKPYDSVKQYYYRSSYGKLTIDGKVLDWFTASHNRSYYQPANTSLSSSQEAVQKREELIKEALAYHAGKGEDFSQYDSDGDGTIDGLYVKWTGDAGAWATYWWAYQTGWSSSSPVVGGKKIKTYVWSWIGNAAYDASHPTIKYYPQVDIHETGHMLGLPDYYDYTDWNKDNNRGGVGGLDIMDGNWGDHNAFSKFLLGWLTPRVVAKTGKKTIELKPSGTDGDAVLIMPGATGSEFGEFYMAQYRKNETGNDYNYPTNGMVIWHIDSRLNTAGNDFMFNNGSSAHKLISLVEADGLGQIGKDKGKRADAGDFYTTGKQFGPSTKPNSNTYAGTKTYVSVGNFGAAGATMSADFEIGAATTLEVTVTDGAKAPVGNLYVTVTDAAGSDITTDVAGEGNTAVTDETGKFKGAINKGKYEVSVTDAAYTQVVSLAVTVSGTGKAALTWPSKDKLDAKKQGAIGGVVLKGGNQPANGVKVKAVNGKSSWSATTNAKGAFQMIVPTGTYTLIVYGEDYSETSNAARQYKNVAYKGIKVTAGMQAGPLTAMNAQTAWGDYDLLGEASTTKAKSGTITVSGSAAAGSTVTIAQVSVDGDTITSKTFVASAVAKASKGAATGTYKVNLAKTYSGGKIVITAMDEAGNWESSSVITLP